MAFMIPNVPWECTPESREGEIFEALKQLPGEYIVIHSFNMLHIQCGEVEEGEIDFVIFHPRKGILCIECKAGAVSYRNGQWFYASNRPMKGNGPFCQAASGKWKLFHKLEELNRTDLLARCKFLHAVWFPSIDRNQLKCKAMPPESDAQMTLTSEALKDPKAAIDAIFEMKVHNVVTTLTPAEVNFLLKNVIQPELNLVPNIRDGEKTLDRLFRQQVQILDVLEEQRYAVISGTAGTGKTLLAVEKARRLADAGGRVLFLCFNLKLWQFLTKNYAHENVDFVAVAEWGYEKAGEYNNYHPLGEWLDHAFDAGEFPYQHVLIDEGQDFGIHEIEEAGIAEKLRDWTLRDENPGGTFYVFYDKYQLVHGGNLPEFIHEADCKLTLFRNCRNTAQILETSMKPLGTVCRKRNLEGCLPGILPEIHIFEDRALLRERIKKVIQRMREEGTALEDIVMLTCKTPSRSILNASLEFRNNEYFYSTKSKRGAEIPFTTCRKFKGMESFAVLLTDVDESCFGEGKISRNLFYVGASRAKQKLEIFCLMNDEQCLRALKNLGVSSETSTPKYALAQALKGTWMPEEIKQEVINENPVAE